MATPPESASLRPAAAVPASELELLTATFDGAGVCLVLLDAEARVLRLNAPCVQLVAHAVQEWAGLPVWQVLPGEDAESVRGHFGTLEQGRTPGPFEQRWATGTGSCGATARCGTTAGGSATWSGPAST